MSRITISFRIYKNAGKTNQNLRVCAKLSGSSQYHPRAIVSFGKGDLTDPDYVKFNSKKQRFENRSKNASSNNALLEKIENFCNAILAENSPSTIEEFWSLVEDAKAGKPVTKDDKTFEWFLHEIIAEYRDTQENKGIWYICDRQYKADKKVFFVDRDYKADLKVFFTGREYKAGWRNNDKKPLMY